MKIYLLIVLFLVLWTNITVQAAPLTLADALSKRAAGSRTLKIAGIEEDIAVESIQSSRSGYLPRVDIQGGYTAQQAPQSISLPVGSFETQQADYGFLSASLNQTLYDFGRTDARYARAQADSEAAHFNSKIQRQELFLKTVTSYFRILKEQKLLLAATQEVIQFTDHHRVAQALYDQGVVTRNDLLQAEIKLAGSRQRLLDATNKLDNSWLDFNNQIGDPPESRHELVEETSINLSDLSTPASAVIPHKAEIQAQRKIVAARDSEVKESRTGYYPEFYARLGLDYVQNDKVKEQALYSATVGFKVNIFDGLATTSRYRQAVKNRSRSEERLQQLESDLALEYRIAINDTRVAQKRIAVTEAAIRQGEENLRINRDRYSEKVGTASDVIDAQTLLTQSRVDNYTALYDYQVALAQVKKARGEL